MKKILAVFYNIFISILNRVCALIFKKSHDDGKATELFWNLRKKAKYCKILKPYFEWKYNKFIQSYGAFIPIGTEIDDCPVFPHGLHGIFISRKAKLGKNVTIFHQVTIGSNGLKDSKHFGAPIIGDNVYIGCGAKIIGSVRIGDNSRIGANACVTHDVQPNSTIVMECKEIYHKEPRNNTFLSLSNLECSMAK